MSAPPTLPAGIDDHIAAFVACRRDRVELAAGTVRWLPLPPGVPSFLGKPKCRFAMNGRRVKATVKWGLASIGLEVWVDDGKLVATTTGFAFGLEGAIERWVDSLNEQLESNGRRLSKIVLAGDDVVILKESAAAS
jgi:hypothetical protein